MPAFWPAVRGAAKFAPVALKAGRRLDRQLRPHVLAYRLAYDVDGYVARWTSHGATHWAVFADPTAREPVQVFPPLARGEMESLTAQLDHSRLRHHSELPEARAWQVAGRIAATPGRATRRLRRDDGRVVDGDAAPQGEVDRGRRPRPDRDDDGPQAELPPAT